MVEMKNSRNKLYSEGVNTHQAASKCVRSRSEQSRVIT